MNSIERFEKAVRLEEPDRVPVAPLVWYHSAVLAGKSERDYREDVDTHLACSELAYEKYKYDMIYLFINPDVVNVLSKNGVRCHPCYNNKHCRIAVLPDPIIKTRKDAKEFIRKGALDYLNLKSSYLKRISKWVVDVLKKYPAFVKKWRKKGVPVEAGGTALGADFTIMLRGLENFFIDMREEPDELIELIKFVNKATKAFAVQCVKIMGKGTHIELGCWFGSSTFIAPSDFDKFVLPYITETSDAVKKAGGKVVLHVDGDYSRSIHKFGRIDSVDLLQLEYTDLFKAKSRVGAKKCIMGGLHPSHLVLHTPRQVMQEAKLLIKKCAPGGGFILGSACEVPPNAKPENIKALVKAAEKYGKY